MKENDSPIISPLGITINEEKIDNNDISDNKPKNFNKIIISYNLTKNNYYITDKELKGYENKEFLLNTLYNFSNHKIFKYDFHYVPTSCERILLLVPLIILICIIIYILTIICTLNPLIINLVFNFKNYFQIDNKI